MFHKASTDPISKILRDGVDLNTHMSYIYTSGTTGLPKAAIITHGRALKGAFMMKCMPVYESDVFYTPLPLYHSAAGIVALGNTIMAGGTLVLRTKFSASQFWEDCRRHDVTVIQYIGELCRYLLARPKSPLDSEHKVRVAFGNGLRDDIWKDFKERFNIANIGELYAATEANAGFINHFNRDGVVGRSSPPFRLLYPIEFIKYDFDTAKPLRDSRGFCIKSKTNEPGLLIMQIKGDLTYDGYKGNRDLSNKKILHDVFKRGDSYFNSGDLIVVDDEYFLHFHDRIGDTFRWKGENVSTIEVSNVVSELPWVEDTNVYGVTVPGQDGRAGMAALTLVDGHKLSPDNMSQLYAQCADRLPVYARPRFLRFVSDMATTSTFKQQKMDLVKEGFNPDLCKSDPVYVIDVNNKTYVTIDQDFLSRLEKGDIRL